MKPALRVRAILSAILVALTLAPCPLLAAGLDTVREATLYIVARSNAPRMAGSGSGFAVRQDDTGLYIITNWHVATLDGANLDCDLVGVLRSGTEREETVPLSLIAFDSVRDLALLRAATVTEAPPILDLDQIVEPAVGTRVCIIGYPLGQGLDLEGKNPAITQTQATVALPCRTPFGLVDTIGMEGGATHGNSGGPVVDEKGNLAGVLVSGVEGGTTIQSIPAGHIQNMWNGICHLVSAQPLTGYGMKCQIQFEGNLVDPFGRVSGLRMVLLPVSQFPADGNLSEFLRLATAYHVQGIPMKSVQPDSRVAMESKLVCKDENDTRFAAAMQAIRRDGSTWLTPPVFFEVKGGTQPFDLATSLDLTQADQILATQAAPVQQSQPQQGNGERASRAYARSEGRLGPLPLHDVPLGDDAGMRTTLIALPSPPLAPPCWLDQGRTALVLDAAGWLTKTTLPSLERTDARQLAYGTTDGIAYGAKLGLLPEPTALAVSSDLVLTLTACQDCISWVHAFRPENLDPVGAFAIPGTVGLSAVPDSARVVLLGRDGIVRQLDPRSGEAVPLCRGRVVPGLRVASADYRIPRLPVDRIAQVVLTSPGDRLLVLGDDKVFPVHLNATGVEFPGPDTPVWSGHDGISYQPGSGQALLTASGGDMPSCILDVAGLRVTDLPPCACNAALDHSGKLVVDVRPRAGSTVLVRQGIEGSNSKSWLLPLSSDGLPTLALAAHPREDGYWLNTAAGAWWVEFGQPWLRRAGLPDSSSTACAGTITKHAKLLDMDVAELRLPGETLVGAWWSRDTDCCVVGSTFGVLRRLDGRSLEVQATVALGRSCRALSGSADGLVALVLGWGDVRCLVLDGKTLQTIRQVALPAGSQVATACGSHLALAAVPGRGVALMDLGQGEVTNPQPICPRSDTGNPLDLRGIADLALAPDGSRAYLLIDGALAVCSVERAGLTAKQLVEWHESVAGQGTGLKGTRLELSADGNYLDITVRSGDRPRHLICPANDPSKILRRYEGDPVVVFDCGAERLLVKREGPYPFMTTVAEGELAMRVRGEPVGRFGDLVLPHPAGNRLLVLGEHRMHLLDYTWGMVR